MILLYVEPSLFPCALQVTLGDVSVHSLANFTEHELEALQLAQSLRELCRQTCAPTPSVVEAIATVLAVRLVKARRGAGNGAVGLRDGLPSDQLNRAVAYIHRNLGGGISLASLAREAFVSRYHFLRLFKRSTGMSPHRYILKCRLLKAKELLGTREFQVADVAYETGFCDQSHLTRHFKKFFGFTPVALLRRRDSQ